MTPINANEIAGDSEANTHAMVEGITTVRVICHSLAPNSRAALMNPSSIERAPSKVLKNTRNTTTIQDVTTFDVSPIPKASTMIGASAMRGNGIHSGYKRLKDITEPVRSPQQQPHRETRRHAHNKSEECILQRDRGCDPEVVFVPCHAFGKVAVEPAIEDAHLGLQATQDQKVLEDFRRLRDE